MRQFQIEQSQERQLVEMAKSFDYRLSDEDSREEAVEATVAVLRIHKQLHGAAWDMGQLLTEQKARLDHGTFGKWLNEVLRWEPRYAQLYMQIFTRWPDKELYLSSGVGLMDFSKQIALSADSAPESATQRVVEIVAERGVAPSVREIKTIVREEQVKVAIELPLEATCDVVRKYARNQAVDQRFERVSSVTMDALQTLAPRGTKLSEGVVNQAKSQVLDEIETVPAPAIVRSTQFSPRYVPADDLDRQITQRVTLSTQQWNTLAQLGDGDCDRGIARLLERIEE
jgi:hypothetical protein